MYVNLEYLFRCKIQQVLKVGINIITLILKSPEKAPRSYAGRGGRVPSR